jgi:hypothetical protein
MESFKLFLTKPSVQSQLSDAKVSVLLQELQGYPVGLSGNGIFVINYDLGVSVRYTGNAIICKFTVMS